MRLPCVEGHLCFNDRLLQKKYDKLVSSLRKDIQQAVRDGKKLYNVEVSWRTFFENKEVDLKVIDISERVMFYSKKYTK